MSIRFAVLGSVLCSILGFLPVLVPVGSASADVGYSQQAKLVGQKPVSGRYSHGWHDIYARLKTCPAGCMAESVGTVQTKLSAYKIAEGLKKYDIYLLDVDMLLSPKGQDVATTMRVDITTQNATVVDQGDTRTITSAKKECQKIQVTMSGSVLPIGLSSTLGTVRFCSKSARLDPHGSGNGKYFVATRLAKISHLTVQRVVKVKAGQHPRFSVKLTAPQDLCTRRSKDYDLYVNCLAASESTGSGTYLVGTNG